MRVLYKQEVNNTQYCADHVFLTAISAISVSALQVQATARAAAWTLFMRTTILDLRSAFIITLVLYKRARPSFGNRDVVVMWS